MKKLFSLLLISLLLLTAPPAQANSNLLNPTWHLVGNNSDAQAYQSVPSNVLRGMSSLTLTYNLHGLCARAGYDSSIIFDQSGWKYVSLANYGTNCLDGAQTVTIPLTDFTGLDTTKLIDNGGYFHTRFWYSSAQAVQEVNDTYNTLKSSPHILGVNYWNLGPAGHESLIDSSYNNLPSFSAVQGFFK